MITNNRTGTKGAKRVDRLAIQSISTPIATRTWRPVSHETLLQTVGAAVEARGLRVVGEEHFLGKGGSRYFGRLKVEHSRQNPQIAEPTDYGFFVGVRNSLDKSYASTIGFGTEVFVCSNGCFSAEWMLNRKHTPEIMEDLPRLTGLVLDKFNGQQATVKHRFDVYKHTELVHEAAHDLIIRGVRLGAANYRQVPTIVDQWYNPNHIEFKGRLNVWRLFNAFTEAAKLGSEADLWDRSLKLQGMMDGVCGFNAPPAEIMTSATTDEVETLK